MDAFFKHENHAWPPSLASNDIMHPATNKSVLVECVESLMPQQEGIPIIDVKIVDGSALVCILDPKKSRILIKTFQDYSQLVFLLYVRCMLQDVVRVYVGWDAYREAQTLLNRGAGHQLRIANNTFIPANWRNFLQWCSIPTPSKCHTGASVGRKSSLHLVRMLYCLQYRTAQSCTALTKKHTHSIIAASSVLHGCEIWVAVGHGSTLRYIPCHLIATELDT